MKFAAGIIWLAAVFPFWVFQTYARWDGMDFITACAFIAACLSVLKDGIGLILQYVSGE